MQHKSIARFAFVWILMFGAIFQTGWTVAAEAPVRANLVPEGYSVGTVTPIYSQIVLFKLPQVWKSMGEYEQDDHYFLALAPEVQIKNDWKEVTVHGFKNLAKNPQINPIKLLNALAGSMKSQCRDAFSFESLGDLKIDTYDAHAALIVCGSIGSESSQSKITYQIAIKGTIDFYLIDSTVRGAAFAKDNAPIPPNMATDFLRALQPIKICDRSEPKNECWERAAR